MYMKPTLQVRNLLTTWMVEGRDETVNQPPFNKALHDTPELAYYIMPRTSFPNGRTDVEYTAANPAPRHARQYWSHANYHIGVQRKMRNLDSRGYWVAVHDIPNACQILLD
jgi:hypothetical protein